MQSVSITGLKKKARHRMADEKENCIEWVNGQDTISVTLSQGRYISKVKKLAGKYPDLVQILHENKDGSIFAHLPLKSLKLSIIPPKELGQEEKERLAKQLRKNKIKESEEK